MPVYAFRTSNYARNIYIYGVTHFADIDPEYVVPVKQYAAQYYTYDQITNAFTQGWITQAEYDETISYMPAT